MSFPDLEPQERSTDEARTNADIRQTIQDDVTLRLNAMKTHVINFAAVLAGLSYGAYEMSKTPDDRNFLIPGTIVITAFTSMIARYCAEMFTRKRNENNAKEHGERFWAIVDRTQEKFEERSPKDAYTINTVFTDFRNEVKEAIEPK